MAILSRKKTVTPEPEPIAEVPTPEPNPAQILEAARAEKERAERAAQDLRQRFIDGHTLTPSQIDEAEREARHAALAVERAEAKYGQWEADQRRLAWATTLEANEAAFSDPMPALQAALAALEPDVKALREKIEAGVNAALANVEAHNGAVSSLGQYIRSGAYTDPDDQASAFGSDVNVRGRAGSTVDGTALVDQWLTGVYPDDQWLKDWMERRRIAAALAYGRP